MASSSPQTSSTSQQQAQKLRQQTAQAAKTQGQGGATVFGTQQTQKLRQQAAGVQGGPQQAALAQQVPKQTTLSRLYKSFREALPSNPFSDFNAMQSLKKLRTSASSSLSKAFEPKKRDVTFLNKHFRDVQNTINMALLEPISGTSSNNLKQSLEVKVKNEQKTLLKIPQSLEVQAGDYVVVQDNDKNKSLTRVPVSPVEGATYFFVGNILLDLLTEKVQQPSSTASSGTQQQQMIRDLLLTLRAAEIVFLEVVLKKYGSFFNSKLVFGPKKYYQSLDASATKALHQKQKTIKTLQQKLQNTELQKQQMQLALGIYDSKGVHSFLDKETGTPLGRLQHFLQSNYTAFMDLLDKAKNTITTGSTEKYNQFIESNLWTNFQDFMRKKGVTDNDSLITFLTMLGGYFGVKSYTFNGHTYRVPSNVDFAGFFNSVGSLVSGIPSTLARKAKQASKYGATALGSLTKAIPVSLKIKAASFLLANKALFYYDPTTVSNKVSSFFTDRIQETKLQQLSGKVAVFAALCEPTVLMTLGKQKLGTKVLKASILDAAVRIYFTTVSYDDSQKLPPPQKAMIEKYFKNFDAAKTFFSDNDVKIDFSTRLTSFERTSEFQGFLKFFSSLLAEAKYFTNEVFQKWITANEQAITQGAQKLQKQQQKQPVALPSQGV